MSKDRRTWNWFSPIKWSKRWESLHEGKEAEDAPAEQDGGYWCLFISAIILSALPLLLSSQLKRISCIIMNVY